MPTCRRKVCQSQDAYCIHMQTGESYCKSCARSINAAPDQRGLVMRKRYRLMIHSHQEAYVPGPKIMIVDDEETVRTIINHRRSGLKFIEMHTVDKYDLRAYDENDIMFFSVSEIEYYEYP